MRVKCISNNNNALAMTIDRVYEVVEEGDTVYRVVNDRNEQRNYLKNHFEVIPDANVVANVVADVADNVVAVNNNGFWIALINLDLANLVFGDTEAGLIDNLNVLLRTGVLKNDDSVTIYNANYSSKAVVVTQPTLKKY